MEQLTVIWFGIIALSLFIAKIQRKRQARNNLLYAIERRKKIKWSLKRSSKEIENLNKALINLGKTMAGAAENFATFFETWAKDNDKFLTTVTRTKDD